MSKTLGEADIGNGIRVYAIGDVHGCLDEMNSLLQQIKDHLQANPIKNHRIIFVGDFVDRGPNSKRVIEQLITLSDTDPKVTCLIGNHDEKLLLATKLMDVESFYKYLRYGGGETLQTYGFPKDQLEAFKTANFSNELAAEFAKNVRDYVTDSHLNFLSELPSSTTQGDYYFCHAGIQPDVNLSDQSRHVLMWIREPFLSWNEPYEKVIIHGHTRQEQPDIYDNRINIDTSCVYGHALTCLVLEGTSYSFLTEPALQNYWI